jgi:hypothetical protein
MILAIIFSICVMIFVVWGGLHIKYIDLTPIEGFILTSCGTITIIVALMFPCLILSTRMQIEEFKNPPKYELIQEPLYKQIK